MKRVKRFNIITCNKNSWIEMNETGIQMSDNCRYIILNVLIFDLCIFLSLYLIYFLIKFSFSSKNFEFSFA